MTTTLFTLTQAQRALVGAAATIHALSAPETKDTTAHAAVGPGVKLAFLLAHLFGGAAPSPSAARPDEQHAVEVAPEGRDAVAPYDVDDLAEDGGPEEALHAAALLRAWRTSCADAKLSTWRTEVLARPSFELFVFDRRLVRAEGGEALDGIVIGSARPLLVRLSAESAGAVASDDATPEGTQGHSIAIVLAPGDAVTVTDPATGDAIVLLRDAGNHGYAWAEAAWSWPQARAAMLAAPMDEEAAARSVVGVADSSSDAADAIAWLGARLHDTPRRASLEPLQAHAAWSSWRQEFITEPARLLAERETGGVLRDLEDTLDALLPPASELELENSEAVASAERIEAAEGANMFARAEALRVRVEHLMMVGGPLADRAHALPRVDAKLDRARVALSNA